MNSETEIKLRHYKNTLSIGGKCYIILGFWAVIKTILQLVLGEESINDLIDQTVEGGVERPIAATMIIITIFIILLLVVIIHLLIGIDAVKIGRGGKIRKRFSLFAGIAALINVAGMAIYPVNIRNGYDRINGVLFASVLVDLSVICILTDLLRSAILLKRLSDQRTEEGA